jgi:hypothetical protein
MPVVIQPLSLINVFGFLIPESSIILCAQQFGQYFGLANGEETESGDGGVYTKDGREMYLV